MNPYDWALTPGLGRAPLLPAPAQPAPVAQNPTRDLARLLLQNEGPNRPGDMPIGALVRDPANMTQMQQIAEMMALGGFPQEGPSTVSRAPSRAVGTMATLAGAPVPGLGLAMGRMSDAGIRNRQRELANTITQGMAEAYESGSHQRDPSSSNAIDAYEQGRQAAAGYISEREQRGGGDRPSRGNQSRETQHSIAI